ncbi:MAG: hypothetical protein KAT70_06950, partial [Thermoplasmata archaeon]|nr:hypothetical protein [Thermoplasmata archaeon]
MHIMFFGYPDSVHLQRWISYFIQNHEVTVVYYKSSSREKNRKIEDLYSSAEMERIVFRPLKILENGSKIKRMITYNLDRILEGRVSRLAMVSEVKKIVKEEKPDIVHGHYL